MTDPTLEEPTLDDLTAVLRGTDADDPSDDARLDDLRERLATRAHAEGALDVAVRTLDSPLGRLLVATTELGVVRVAFESEDHDAVLHQLAGRIGPRVLRSVRLTDAAARQIEEYFAGTRRSFDVAVDLRLLSGFRAAVVARLAGIGYGETASYAQVAALAGRPTAVRAVGSACSHNPVPIVVPCHRVVRSDGTIGRYLGGTEAKRRLLALEAGGRPAPYTAAT